MDGKHLLRLVIVSTFAAYSWGQTPITSIFSTGFEPTAYLPGSLNGQQSWQGNLAIVQSAVVNQGTQAVRFDPGPNRDVARSIAFDTASRSEKVVRLRVDAYLASGGTPEYWTVIAVPFSSTRIDINVDQSSQIVVFDGTPHFTRLTVPRDSWHQFGNILDFGSRRFDITLDGVVVYTGTLPGSDSGISRVGFTGQNSGTQLAYWDNLSITADPRASQTANLLSSPSPSALGQPITLTAQLPVRVSRPTSNPAPSGRVTFMDASIALGSAPVLAGTATLTTSSLSSGLHQLRFFYSGDADYAPLASSAVIHNVIATRPGSFLSAVSYPAGTEPRSIVGVAGDLVVANYAPGTQGGFTTLPSAGGGKFGSPVFLQVGPSISNVGVVDLNGDASPDFFLPGNSALFISPGIPPTSTLPQRFVSSLGGPARSVGAGAVATDLNRDGMADLILSGVGSSGSGYLSVLMGKSAASFDFLPYGQYPADDAAVFVTSGDFNGDGWPDIAVANSGAGHAAGSVAIYLNTGGVLAPPVKYAGNAYSVFAVDVNRDGLLDLVTGAGSTPSIGVLIGNGDGTFKQPVYFPTRGGGAYHALPVDFGSGAPDLFVTSFNANTVEWLTNNGSGGFSSRGVWTVGARPNSVTAGDFNGDGLLDLAVANGDSTVSVLIGAPAGSTTVTVLTSTPNPSSAGQAVTLTATVTPSTATGSVNFFDGTSPLGVASLSGGAASLVVTTLAAGTRQLTAVYAGDNQNPSSTSAVLNHVVSSSTSSPAWTITKTHTGNFTQGQNGVTYIITVRNSGSAPTAAGPVQVSDTLPAGLTAVSFQGTGWSCQTTTCVRSDSLAPGASYPSLFLTVNVAASAAGSVSNMVSVSGGGATGATASDPTTISGGSQTFSISGVISGTGGTCVSGVDVTAKPSNIVTLSGAARTVRSDLPDTRDAAAPGNLVSGTDGSYAVTGLIPGSYLVTPSKIGCTFSPPFLAVNLTSNSTGNNFTGTLFGLTSTPNPSFPGQAVTLTVTASATATGSVVFSDGTAALGQASLSNGAASLVVTTLAIGSRQLTALYLGDAKNSNGTSTVAIQVVSDSTPPYITALAPTFISAGSPGFGLVVSGRGFCSASRARWSTTDLVTTISNGRLTAVVPATLIASPDVVPLYVINPAGAGCGAGGTSSAVSYTISPSLPPGNQPLVVQRAARMTFDPANLKKQTVTLPVRTTAGGIPQQPVSASAITITGTNWLTVTGRSPGSVDIELDPAKLQGGKGTFVGWITYSSAAVAAKTASGTRFAESDCQQKSTRVEFSDSSTPISFGNSPLQLTSAAVMGSTTVDPVGSAVTLPVQVTATTEEGGGAPCWLSFSGPDNLNGQLSTGVKIDVRAALTGLAPGSSHSGFLMATSGRNSATPLEVNLVTARTLDAGDGSVEVSDDNPADTIDLTVVDPDAASGTKAGNLLAAGSRLATVAVPFTAVCSGCGKAFTVETSSNVTPAKLTVRVDPKSTDTSPGVLEISSPGLDTVRLPVVYNHRPAQQVDTPVIAGIGQAFDNSSQMSSNTFIQIYGTGLGPDICVFPRCDWGNSFVNGKAPTLLQGTRVMVNDRPAFVSYVSPKQINALTPDDPFVGDVTVQVIVNGTASNKLTVRKSAATPALNTDSRFLINGRQYMAAQIADSAAAWVVPGPITGLVTRAARVGEFITVFGVGCGAGSVSHPVGELYSGISPLAGAVSIRIGNVPVTEATGFLPGALAGLCQFNIRIPAGVPTGSQPVTLQIGNAAVTQTLYTLIQ